MKRPALALTLILALSVTIIASLQTLEVAKANFLPAPAIIIYSPYPTIYTNTSIPLNVAVNILHDSPEIVRILYCVDESSNVTLTNLTRRDNEWFDPYKWGSVFQATSILNDLAEGNHTLKVFVQDASGEEMFRSVEFTVDTHFKYPEVLVLSPENKTYATAEVPLTWICNEQIVSAHYTLDDLFKPLSGNSAFAGNATLPGNTTLTELSNGTHTITVNVITGRGFASQTVSFTVNPAVQQQTEAFPTTLVVAVSIAVVVAVGVLVYFKKRKR
jgi:hypothetical protein